MNFAITGKKGFRITFPNGYSLSVQFGPANYGTNYDMRIGEDNEKAGRQGADTVETAILHPAGGLMEDPEDKSEYADTVQGYQTVEQVMERMMRVYSWPKPSDNTAAGSELK